MGHGHDVQAPIEDAINVIPPKIQFVDVVLNLLVGGGVAKAQIAVLGPQTFQVRTDSRSVLDAQNANRDPLHPAAPE